MEYSLTITHPKVINFYKKHTGISFEQSSLLMVELLEQVVEEKMTTSMVSQLVDNLKMIESQVRVVSESVTRYQEDIILKMNVKLMEMKKEYIEDVKIILSSNISDKINPLLKEQGDNLIAKTNLLLNELLPKTNDTITTKINDTIKDLQRSIQEDNNRLSANPESFNELLSSMDSKFTTAMLNTQLALSSTNEKIDYGLKDLRSNHDQQISSVKELNNLNQQTIKDALERSTNDIKQYNEQQFTTVKDIASTSQLGVTEMLKKMDGASTKGKVSENILSSILQKMYPSGDIQFVGTTKESGDFILKRDNKPTILIENKNWERNVIQEEVKKFLRDIELNKCCGLFLSQNTGVANKQNYEINIHDGNVLVYIHYVNNDPEKIKIGIDIIDHFKEMLSELESSDVDIDTISKDVLIDINKEYNIFASQKLIILKTIKDFHQTMTKQLDIMSFPSLKEFLGTRYGESSSGEKCEFCGRSCKNYAALKAHHRGCKKENIVISIEPMIQEVEVLPENEFTNMNLSQLKEECKKRNINTSGKKKEDLLKSLN
uniref:SAP domain-containing protein n=1 Tax=viral metagenome TaxID=1070528 RepID=A0A6C0ET76_9ZZZZ